MAYYEMFSPKSKIKEKMNGKYYKQNIKYG